MVACLLARLRATQVLLATLWVLVLHLLWLVPIMYLVPTMRPLTFSQVRSMATLVRWKHQALSAQATILLVAIPPHHDKRGTLQTLMFQVS